MKVMREVEERILGSILGVMLGLPMGFVLWFLSERPLYLVIGMGIGFVLGALLYEQDRVSYRSS
jgi:F0F1-type ATP synthase assembly protein I